jgi:hypothetical protein
MFEAASLRARELAFDLICCPFDLCRKYTFYLYLYFRALVAFFDVVLTLAFPVPRAGHDTVFHVADRHADGAGRIGVPAEFPSARRCYASLRSLARRLQ